MKHKILLSSATLLTLTALSRAASFDFSGVVHADSLTAIPWVGPSTMWGAIARGSGTGTSQSGFTYFNTHAITDLSFSFGDLELSSHLSPGPAFAGFEVYTETDSVLVPFSIKLSGTEIASGVSLELTTHVSDSSDFVATGTGKFQVTTPGADPTFYNEVMTLTAGSGLFHADITSFAAVDIAGNFSSLGTMTAVPEPSTFAAGTALALLGFAAVRRMRNH